MLKYILFLELGDLFLAHAQAFLQDLVVVLTQQRRAHADGGLVVGKLQVAVGDLHLAGHRVVALHKHLTGAGNVGICHHAVDGVDRTGGDTSGQKQFHNVVDLPFPGPALNDGLQGRVVLYALDVLVKLLILQLGDLEHALEQVVELVVAAGDDDIAVGGLEGVVGVDGLVAVADGRGHAAGAQVDHVDDLQGGNHAVHQRDVYLVAHAGLQAVAVSSQYADAAAQAAHDIGNSGAGAGGRGIGPASGAHQTAHGLANDVVARPLGFLPSLDLGPHVSVELILTDFKLLYESVKAGMKGSLLQTNINDTRKIDLKYNQNSFSISFSAINFAVPHRIRYEYRLENHNEEWEHSNSVRNVSYMNLSSGKYVFRLRAFDKYTGQQVGERSLDIVIHNPYWVSWWALFIYFILLSVFVYMFVQYRRHKVNEGRIRDKIRSFISIAHDIRTPVTLIKAPLSELEAQEGLPEQGKKTVAVAMKNVEKLMGMITQLLELQKTELHAEECLKVSPYDIKAYLEEKMAEFHLAAMQKSVGIELEVEPDMPKVWIDREKMDHIIDNLLSNALKYTEKGVIHILVKTARKKWTIEVKDTGIGIPKEEQGNIFHEYYRAQNAMNFEETGSGIGLMITRRIVKQHHGTISFSSVEGQGTTFTVTFPQRIKASVAVEAKADGREEAQAATGAVHEETERARKNVLLLAEDDADMREYLVDSLSSEYKVVAVPDGGKALETAREINPDIIISDIVMPVLEGDELCRILKSSVETSHIPIILLTALSERENIIFGLEAGANDYIIKPFDLSVLKVRIRNILQNRQHLRETVLAMDAQPEETDYTSQLDKEFLDKVMKVIEEELSDSEFSINDFCRMLGMSRTSVYNKIKTLTGQGPNDFIRIVRLNKAKELLVSRKYSIGEVANMVGFSDPKYFSTCFKKQFGTSPSKI